MKSINDLLKKHPDLYKKLNSEQRNLSKQLLKIRLKKQKKRDRILKNVRNK